MGNKREIEQVGVDKRAVSVADIVKGENGEWHYKGIPNLKEAGGPPDILELEWDLFYFIKLAFDRKSEIGKTGREGGGEPIEQGVLLIF